MKQWVTRPWGGRKSFLSVSRTKEEKRLVQRTTKNRKKRITYVDKPTHRVRYRVRAMVGEHRLARWQATQAKSKKGNRYVIKVMIGVNHGPNSWDTFLKCLDWLKCLEDKTFLL